VRFDPANPARFALSWAQDSQVWRWLAVLFFGVMLGGVFAGTSAVVGFRLLRALSDARSAAARPQRWVLKVTGVTEVLNNGKPTGAHAYTYEAEEADGFPAHAGTFRLGKGQKPLALEEDRILALRPANAPARPVVLHANGYPFALSAQQLEALTQPTQAPTAQAAWGEARVAGGR
jgi:hypothetical protein